MRRSLIKAFLAVSVSGCVSVTQPNSYRPLSSGLSQDFYACSQSSNEPRAAVAWGSKSGSGSAGMRVDPNMLLRCMEARNYRLRKPTTSEIVMGTIFFPIWIPWVVLYGAPGMVIGGGPGEDSIDGVPSPSNSGKPVASAQAATRPSVEQREACTRACLQLADQNEFNQCALRCDGQW